MTRTADAGTCPSMTSVTYFFVEPGNVSKFGKRMFSGCCALHNVRAAGNTRFCTVRGLSITFLSPNHQHDSQSTPFSISEVETLLLADSPPPTPATVTWPSAESRGQAQGAPC